jgi:hypothetical protein
MSEPTPELIWWVTVQPGEFFNVERHPQMQTSRVAGGGSQYFEIPGSLVQDTFELLGYHGSYESFEVPHTIVASAVGRPDLVGPIEFNKKAPSSGRRLYITRQNRQAPNNLRHPAWLPSRGFPQLPDGVRNDEAGEYLPEGGLRLYILRMDNGEFRTGFTTGYAPVGLADDDPNRLLYQTGRGGLERLQVAGLQ